VEGVDLSWANGVSPLELETLNHLPLLCTLERVEPEMHAAVAVVPSTAQNASDPTNPLIIAEGTATGVTVAAFAPEDAIVACVLTPNRMTQKTLATPGLSTLSAGRRVILYLEDEPDKSKTAHAKAKAITDLLTTGASKAASVEVITTPIEDLRGWLTTTDDPTSVLADLIAAAQPIKSIKPPAKQNAATAGQTDLGYFVSTLLGEIVAIEAERRDDDGNVLNLRWGHRLAGQINGQPVYANQTLLGAAPTIIKVLDTKDDLAPHSLPQRKYVVDIQFGPEGDCKHYPTTIDDGLLNKVDEWRLGVGPHISRPKWGQGDLGGAHIAEAIRDTREGVRAVKQIRRVGWGIDDEGMWRYVDAAGGIGPDGKSENITAVVDNPLDRVKISDPSGIPLATVKKSLQELFDAERHWKHTEVWVTATAALFMALSGQHPRGGLWNVGKNSSGKSLVASLIGSAFAPTITPDDKHTFTPGDSPSATRKSIWQCDNLPMITDDIRPLVNLQELQKQTNNISVLGRVAYEGGGIVNTISEHDGVRWNKGDARETHPFIWCLGEIVPSENEVSTLDRFLIIEMVGIDPDDPDPDKAAKASIRPGGAKALQKLGKEHAFMPAVAAYIQYRARTIATEFDGDFERARVALEETTKDAAEPYLDRLSGNTSRLRDVAWTHIAGVWVAADFAKATGELTSEAGDSLFDRWANLIIAAAQRHADEHMSNASSDARLIDAIKGRIASGKFCIGPQLVGAEEVIGEVVRPRDLNGAECVALIPLSVQAIAKSIGITSGVAQILKPVLIPSKDGKLRVANINGHSLRAYVIKPEAMDPGEYRDPFAKLRQETSVKEERPARYPHPPTNQKRNPRDTRRLTTAEDI
jgi:hypothetical protein